MKTKFDRPSYFLGVLAGIFVGLMLGYLSAITQSIHSLVSSDSGQVLLGIAALQKLSTGDVASTERMIAGFLASTYVRHTDQQASKLMQYIYQDHGIARDIDNAAHRLPVLAEEMERWKKDSANQPVERTF